MTVMLEFTRVVIDYINTLLVTETVIVEFQCLHWYTQQQLYII